MGKLPLSVMVSAAVHIPIIGWVGTRELAIDDTEVEPATQTPIELVDTFAIAPATVDVRRSDDTRELPIAPATSSSHDRSTSRRRARSTTTTTTGGETSHEPSTERRPGDRSKYFEMRRGDRVDLSLPATRDDLDRAPAGTQPQSGTPSSGTLAPDGTGRRSDQGPVVAAVDRDGDVAMTDRPDVSIRVAVPTPTQIGRGIAEWYESDKGPDGKRGKRTLVNEIGGTIDVATAGCDGVRDSACAPDRTLTVIVPVFRGGLDPTAWLMRKTVGDPYASKKRAYLDATREERAQIRAEHRARQLRDTAKLVRESLERAWHSTTDVAVRKQRVFELWDEIVEPADDEPALAEAARVARAQVIGFIRARLPQRGADAYQADEIAALNAKKRSKVTFSPYE